MTKKKTLIDNKIVTLSQLAPYTVRFSVIYPEQQICAYNTKKVLDKNINIPVISAQTQQGKTGATIFLAYLFAKECIELGLPYQIIFLLNVSDLELKEQTYKRLIEAGLMTDCFEKFEDKVVFNLHHKDLTSDIIQEIVKKAKNNSSMRTLIIVDEAHVAQGERGPFSSFMKRLGVKLGKVKSTWTNQNINVVSVSATPYGHAVKEKIRKGGYEFVKLPLSPNYYSLEHMKNANRLFSSEAVISKSGEITDWFKDRLKEFIMYCKKENGHMILRVHNAKNAEKISMYIYNTYKASIGTMTFDCSKSSDSLPISELSNKLSTKPEKPIICIIKNSLRVGKTISTTKYLKMWIDSSDTKADTIVQSIGRCCGYSTDFDKDEAKLNGVDVHTKFNDTFPIFCDMKEIDLAIEFYNGSTTSVPSGIMNTASLLKQTSGNGIIVALKAKVGDSSKIELKKLIEPHAKQTLTYKKGFEDGKLITHEINPSVSLVSSSDSNNWPDHIFHFHASASNVTNFKDGKRGCRIICLDHVKSDIKKELKAEHTESWTNLISKYPKLKDKFVYVMYPDEFKLLKSTLDKNGYYYITPEVLTEEKEATLKTSSTHYHAVKDENAIANLKKVVTKNVTHNLN